MPRTKEVTFSIPGWISVTLEPNQAEQEAAWSLYVELSTRIATQPFHRESGQLRPALDSLYSLFAFTRGILREGGPAVARGPDSVGPIAIRFLTEVLAPFTSKWHQRLATYEATKPDGLSEFQHERNWEDFDDMLAELETLQKQVQAYVHALGRICAVI